MSKTETESKKITEKIIAGFLIKKKYLIGFEMCQKCTEYSVL